MALLVGCLTACAAWLLSSSCASSLPPQVAMHTNAPTPPPQVVENLAGRSGLVALGGLRVEQPLVEQFSDLGAQPQTGRWTTSPMGVWGQIQWQAAGLADFSPLVGGEYGAGWSVWGGNTFRSEALQGSAVQAGSILLGATRQQTQVWQDPRWHIDRTWGRQDSSFYADHDLHRGTHVWMRFGTTLQRKGSGPWGELAWVPLFSWDDAALGGHITTLGTVALGWHQPLGEHHRIVAGWRGLATPSSWSNQGLLLWQVSFAPRASSNLSHQ